MRKTRGYETQFPGSSSSRAKVLRIGNTRVPIRNAKNPELVPRGHVEMDALNKDVRQLKWLLQKDQLNQDIFLIGVPGSIRSNLVLQYLELTNREFEYLSLTRDTTEADIKQRREIRSNSAVYTDLCAVRAALNGRVLVIDGVEKAERNVLPILNNLLENREMQLDDGRFLMKHDKFDKLLQKYDRDQLKEMKLERVSEDFFIIAFGLPTTFPGGHSLDPPLRSRLQCLNMSALPFHLVKDLCESWAPKVDKSKLEKLISLAYGLNSQKDTLGLPRLSIDNLMRAVAIWDNNPHSYSEGVMFKLCYPIDSILRDTELTLLNQFFQTFGLTTQPSVPAKIKKIETNKQNAEESTVTVDYGGRELRFETKTGSGSSQLRGHPFVSTPRHESLLVDLALTHTTADFCLLAPPGSGKTILIEEFARRFHYDHVETIALYQDLNSRELLQSRQMLVNGDTAWRDSPLVQAAKRGDLCVLDGLDRIHWSTAEVLAPLIYHRFLHLPDGTRLISSKAFGLLKEEIKCTADELNQKGIFEISPRFRLVALADSESVNASGPKAKWLNEQILSLFVFHTLPRINVNEELELITKLLPNVHRETAAKLIQFVHKLQESHDTNIRSVGLSLSLRRLIFILRRHTANPSEGVYEAIHRAALARFLPSVTRIAFEKALRDLRIEPNLSVDQHSKQDFSSISRAETSSVADDTMIPDIVFYENKQHLQVMSSMAKDFELGAHLLLIGNQGVGKNKVVDRFLQLIKRPRHYLQLHRDTTVQSLTVQSTVIDGVLRHEDSPLVKSVRDGLVLVIDEADKAPLHVLAVMKSLLDSGFLYLSDGRRIQPADVDPLPNGESITMNPDFRLIMLANRPGFPFLGNDLFGILGDLFAVHVVNNPDRESEITMLRQYGPNVKREIIDRLVAVFCELRDLSDSGQLSYPYSTRELVSIVKHLDRFPDDPIPVVVRNVFDFDAFSKDTIEIVEKTFRKRGIPLGLNEEESGLNVRSERLEIEKDENDFDLSKLNEPKFGKVDPKNTPHVGGNTWAGGTGGYNTAGLGGVGGPFRLDAGHDVHQISEEAKRQVPEEIKQKARAIAKREYEKRLKEIEMSTYASETYQSLYSKVAKSVNIMKTVLDSLEAKEKERLWAKHQTSGDLDDTKLIEGMTGEKTIYRKRVESTPEPGTAQTKPKMLRLLVDVSASMYRFNGHDKRLQKSIETTLLVMESLSGKEKTIKYEIHGHSGETPSHLFVSADRPPKNEKQRLDVLEKMTAHTQFCYVGDRTIEAIEIATRELAEETNVDERFLIALSDANFDRYQIEPHYLSEVLTREETVNSFFILIGSMGKQAEQLKSSLPAGKVFIARSTDELPQIMQQIFASTLIK